MNILLTLQCKKFGGIQVLHNAMGVVGVTFSSKKHYAGVLFNFISVTRKWVGVKFPEKNFV